jgi:hypothetical protein
VPVATTPPVANINIITPDPRPPPTPAPSDEPSAVPSSVPSLLPNEQLSGSPNSVPSTRPTTARPCEIKVQIDCEEARTVGKKCDEIRPVDFLVCDCDGQCAVTYTLQYAGAECSESYIPKEGVTCYDNASGPKPEVALISVETEDARSVFNDMVNLNDEFILYSTGTSCIPEILTINIYDGFDPDQPYQTLTVNTRCTGAGLSLGESVGAVGFTGYTCPNGVTRNCLTEVAFEM